MGGEKPMSHVVSHVASGRQKVDTQTSVLDEGSFLHLSTLSIMVYIAGKFGGGL